MFRRIGLKSGVNKHVLDFSCGEGRNAEYLYRMGFNVHATEVSKSAIASAKKRFTQNGIEVDLCLMDISGGDLTLKFAECFFDLIIAWQCLHWMGSKENFVFTLNEFKRVLKPDGGIIFTMPTDSHGLIYNSEVIGDSQYRILNDKREAAIGVIFYSPTLEKLEQVLDSLDLQLKETMGYAIWEGVNYTREHRHDDYNFYVVFKESLAK